MIKEINTETTVAEICEALIFIKQKEFDNSYSGTDSVYMKLFPDASGIFFVFKNGEHIPLESNSIKIVPHYVNKNESGGDSEIINTGLIEFNVFSYVRKDDLEGIFDLKKINPVKIRPSEIIKVKKHDYTGKDLIEVYLKEGSFFISDSYRYEDFN